MSQLNKTSWKNLYGTTGTVFPDNTTSEISEGDMRTFGENAADSIMFLDDNFIDEDDFASNSATKAPSQQSTKAYVDAAVASAGGVSGTYTPTVTLGSNVDAATPQKCLYSRVGNIVTVAGCIDVDATSNASVTTIVYISLPIPSNFTSSEDAAGHMGNTFSPGTARAEPSTDTVYLGFKSYVTNNVRVEFIFMYEVK